MEVNKPYYRARGVDYDERLAGLVPPDYLIYRRSGKGWEEITSFETCAPLDNVFLVPREKAALRRFQVFTWR
jgi:hypothetical protein